MQSLPGVLPDLITLGFHCFIFSFFFFTISMTPGCFPDKRALYVFRKSSGDTIPRARKKVMRLTVALTLAFLVCWSPYYGMELWYHIDRYTIEKKVSPVVFDGLWSLSFLNVCLDPVMYGFFNIKLCQRCGNSQTPVGSKQQYERIRMLFVLPPWRSKNVTSGSGKGSATERIS